MESSKVLYWSRVGLGVLAALACTFLGLVDFISGVSFGILFYILTHYILKRWFAPRIEKQSKIFTTGIGAYFLSWIVSWGLFYTVTLWALGLV